MSQRAVWVTVNSDQEDCDISPGTRVLIPVDRIIAIYAVGNVTGLEIANGLRLNVREPRDEVIKLCGWFVEG